MLILNHISDDIKFKTEKVETKKYSYVLKNTFFSPEKQQIINNKSKWCFTLNKYLFKKNTSRLFIKLSLEPVIKVIPEYFLHVCLSFCFAPLFVVKKSHEIMRFSPLNTKIYYRHLMFTAPFTCVIKNLMIAVK